MPGATENLSAAVDCTSLFVVRQSLQKLLDHGDERVRNFAAAGGRDLIEHQVAGSGGEIAIFLECLEREVGILRLVLGRERRARAQDFIAASTAATRSGVPEPHLLALQTAVLRARRPLRGRAYGSGAPRSLKAE